MVASIPAILLLAIAQSISSASNHHHPITRIVGGHQVNITDAPWQVSLEYRGKHLCGGSIISNRWIVTAAKCLPYDTNDWQFMKVRVGTGDKEKNGQLLEVDKTVMHPRWTPVNMDYDFGLILLDDALEFTDRIRPIRLAAADYAIATGTKCLVTGWGLTNHPDQSTNKLRGVMVPIVDQHTCQRAHAAYMTFQPRMICAGDFEHGGIDACLGDQGGPLVAFNGEKDAVLVGSVSWGRSCAQPKLPGVYSRISAAREWIKSVTNI